MQTSEIYRDYPLKGTVSQISKDRSGEKEKFDVLTHHYFKNMKTLYLRKKLRVRLVVDYANKRFSNFAIEYVSSRKRISLQNRLCQFRSNLFPKLMIKNLLTLSLLKKRISTWPSRWRSDSQSLCCHSSPQCCSRARGKN